MEHLPPGDVSALVRQALACSPLAQGTDLAPSMVEPKGVSTQVAQLGGPDGLDLPGWAAMSFDDQVTASLRAWKQPIARLLIFDNLEDPALLKRWRPVGSGSRVLIIFNTTSANRSICLNRPQCAIFWEASVEWPLVSVA
jgi:hypothetical protein